jgi:hypothetical protein
VIIGHSGERISHPEGARARVFLVNGEVERFNGLRLSRRAQQHEEQKMHCENPYRAAKCLRYSFYKMSKLGAIVSATIVLIFAHPRVAASPQEDFPEDKTTQTAPPSQPIDDNMSISEPPHVDGSTVKGAQPRYYPYHQEFTIRAGLSSTLYPWQASEHIWGFQYMLPRFLSPKFEAGADLHEEGEGHVHLGVRWILRQRSYFRPSYKLGLDHHLESKENLATFARLSNYYVRGAVALEFTVDNPISVRLEMEVLVGSKDTLGAGTAGLTYGW